MVTARTQTAAVRTPAAPGDRRILVAVTDGPNAKGALEAAARLAGLSTSRVRLLHLQRRITQPSKSGIAIEIETYAQAVDFASRMRGELRELGVDADVQVGRESSGREAEQIIAAAHEFGADLIIAGNHTKSRLDTLLRGSTSRDLVRKSPIPLLLVN